MSLAPSFCIVIFVFASFLNLIVHFIVIPFAYLGLSITQNNIEISLVCAKRLLLIKMMDDEIMPPDERADTGNL